MAWVFLSQIRGENQGLHGSGFPLTNEKIQVTIAQTCCKKEKTLDLLGLGCFSHG
jgi:hypothetical protein